MFGKAKIKKFKINTILVAPLANLDEFYGKIGIKKYTEAYQKKYGKKIPVSNHFLMNEKTDSILRSVIKETWENYNVNRFTGTYKGKGPHLYTRKTKLTKSDEAGLGMHFLGYGPTIANHVPDGEFWLVISELPYEKRRNSYGF